MTSKVSWVAGAAGFVGSHLCDDLLDRGHEVVGIDNLATGSLRNLEAARAREGFQFHAKDICEGAFEDLPRPSHIWNLASPASPPHYQRMPIETLMVGSVGSRNLLEVARAEGARYLFASTSEIYGDPLVHPQPEEYWGHVNPVGPRSMYDEAKRFGEALSMAYARSQGVTVRIARIFNTYGPRMALHDGRVVPNFIGQALEGAPLTIYGDGSQTRSFCYVSDTVRGLVLLMLGEERGPVNIGNATEHTILEFAQRIRAHFGQKEGLVFQPLPVDDPRQRRPDISRAAEALGWRPTVDLDDGLEKTIRYFRSLEPAVAVGEPLRIQRA